MFWTRCLFQRHFALLENRFCMADQGSCASRILRWRLSSTTHLSDRPRAAIMIHRSNSRIAAGDRAPIQTLELAYTVLTE